MRKKGFDLFCEKDAIRRLTTNFTAVKADSNGYHIIELKDGRWTCDCSIFNQNQQLCEHICAAQLARNTNRNLETEMKPSCESSLKCRYCGSPDVSRCGFRYNARGISRRYFCHECERKFSIRIVGSQQAIVNIPTEVVWLLNEVGLQISRLNGLLVQLDSKINLYSGKSLKA